jgi:hypothetical protein
MASNPVPFPGVVDITLQTLPGGHLLLRMHPVNIQFFDLCITSAHRTKIFA